MTYRNHHFGCKDNCKTYTAYIRIKNKWTPIGEYHTECRTLSIDKTEESQNKEDSWTVYDRLDAKNLEMKFQKAREEFVQNNLPQPEEDKKDEDLSVLINSLS